MRRYIYAVGLDVKKKKKKEERLFLIAMIMPHTLKLICKYTDDILRLFMCGHPTNQDKYM